MRHEQTHWVLSGRMHWVLSGRMHWVLTGGRMHWVLTSGRMHWVLTGRMQTADALRNQAADIVVVSRAG